ncbi:MAG TPA: DUF2252 domain-containing protein [Candidatus Binataceae bacterium]|nr:DUF2252 domain-containing protein [Candidatus Binataceae bacterium]
MRKALGATRAAPALSAAERMMAGRALREQVPRSSHGEWQAAVNRADPVAILREFDHNRIAELLPIRYGRMKKSPFAFLRGAAAIMAADLARTPATGLRVQAGGDCHIMNFGAFATAERNLIFDINDFDETLPAPWEWDIKRLAASIEVAARTADFKTEYREEAVRAATRAYREHMAEYAAMRVLEVWYQRIDLKALIRSMPRDAERAETRRAIEKARRDSTPGHLFPALARSGRKPLRINDAPPLIYHPAERHKAAFRQRVLDGFERYAASLPPAYRQLFQRYELQDIAIKVVGVGSVGTFCAVALFTAAEDDPLFLQVKEAGPSVLEPYAGASAFTSHGERVVVGQRLMQSAGDILLGWTEGLEDNRHFYIRQLRDMKIAMPIETAGHTDLEYFAEACGWALALAHARSGDSAMIAGYLGSGEAFDDALVNFAAAYADQTERDYAALLKAIKAGRIKAASA